MMKAFITLFSLLLSLQVLTQNPQEQVGAWYMYFYDLKIKEGPWGVQGDVQFRNWDIGTDLEQLLLRSGLTYRTGENLKFTLGYGHITSGAFGDSDATVTESRIYQELIFPKALGGRFTTKHRFRYEQRFVEDQDFRTRYRYNLFLNIALNKKKIEAKSLYLGLYNELFINGQKNIGDGRSVELFDRNRSYAALGYVIKQGLAVQAGYMRQSSNSSYKDQLQLSLHQNF